MGATHQIPTYGRPRVQKTQYYLILSNLPHNVIQQPRTEDWKLVKDIIYHQSLKHHGLDRDFGKCDIFPAYGLALCDFNNPAWRQLAYNDLQDYCWRGVQLKAWLCEKRGSRMEQSAGPIDPRTGRIIPAPVYRIDIGPTLTRCLGCVPLGFPFGPARSMYTYSAYASPAPVFQPAHQWYCDDGAAQAEQMFLSPNFGRYDPVAMLPTLSDGSRTSSSSTVSVNLSSDSSENVSFHNGPSFSGGYHYLPKTAAAKYNTGGGNPQQAGYRGFYRPKDATANYDSCRKIEIRHFDSKTDIDLFRQSLEDILKFKIMHIKSCKGNNKRGARIFATLRNKSDAEQAVRSLNGQVVAECKLEVMLDKPGHRPWMPRANLTPAEAHVKEIISSRSIDEPETSQTVTKNKSDVGVKPVRKGPLII